MSFQSCANLPHCTLLCIVLQEQFLSSPLDTAQHIKTVSEARSKGHVMGQGHSKLEVSEWQRGDKPGAEITLSRQCTNK